MHPSSSSRPAFQQAHSALLARVARDATGALVVCAGEAPHAVVLVNPAFEHLTGISARAAAGRQICELLRPPGGQFEWERVAATMAGRAPWRKALPAARADGTVFWADIHLYPLLEECALTHWVLCLSDVTEHLELHDALRRSEAQHRLLAENIRDLISAHGPDGRCLFASASSYSLLGYKPEELVGSPLRFAFHPDDRSAARRIFAGHFTGRNESVFVHRIRRRDGTFLWAETTSKTRWEAGDRHPVQVVSITRDISKRHAAEDGLRATHALLDAIYERVPFGLCVLDGSQGIERCNPAFAAAFGLPAAEVCSGPLSRFIPPELVELASSSPAVSCEGECIRGNGLPFPAEITVVPLDAPSTRRLVLLTDVGERKKIEARLREANQAATLGTLAGGIAHDFNNMLAIVLAYASLLRDAAGDTARVTHYADTIIDAGRRGADVVRQLQLFASIQQTEFVNVDVHGVIQELLASASTAWPANIRIVQSRETENPRLSADPTQLVLALQKLLDHALAAMPGGGTLTVRTSDISQATFTPGTAAESKRLLRVSVEDSGDYLDEATRTRMFEPFFITRGKHPTSGVGLAVVRGIMRAHGGSIEVDSTRGAGTRVHLLFPRTELADPASAPPFAPAPAAPPTQPRTILLVEDEQDIGSLWMELLPVEGWRVLWARDGGEAVRLFRAHRDEIALVFTDIGLPVLDGWHVADAVRRDAPSMPLLLASGSFRRDVACRSYAEPVAYIGKPYTPTQIIEQLHRLAPTPAR